MVGDIDPLTGRAVAAPIESDSVPQAKPCPPIDERATKGFGLTRCCNQCPDSAVVSFLQVHAEARARMRARNRTGSPQTDLRSQRSGAFPDTQSLQFDPAGSSAPDFLNFVEVDAAPKAQSPRMDELRNPDDPTLVVEMPPCCPYCVASFYDQSMYTDLVALPSMLAPGPNGAAIQYLGPILKVSKRATGKEIIFIEAGGELPHSAPFTESRVLSRRIDERHLGYHRRRHHRVERASDKRRFPKLGGLLKGLLSFLKPVPPPSKPMPPFVPADPKSPCCQACPGNPGPKPRYKWGPPADA